MLLPTLSAFLALPFPCKLFPNSHVSYFEPQESFCFPTWMVTNTVFLFEKSYRAKMGQGLSKMPIADTIQDKTAEPEHSTLDLTW
jgi:hypothetical protein